MTPTNAACTLDPLEAEQTYCYLVVGILVDPDTKQEVRLPIRAFEDEALAEEFYLMCNELKRANRYKPDHEYAMYRYFERQRVPFDTHEVSSSSYVRGLEHALKNIRMLASKHRREEWAGHLLRFCADAGVLSSPFRADKAETALLEEDTLGWIPWGGGACPVDSNAQVRIKTQEGFARAIQTACDLDWSYTGRQSDILAYKLYSGCPAT
ncbi:MAG: hypothetical protein ACYC3W_09320 [Candidatus Nanopelagicales bacterium]